MVFKRPAAAVFKRPAAVPLVLPCLEKTLETPDWFDEPDEAAQSEVFLVTAASIVNDQDKEDGAPLRDPSAATKEDFQKALFDSIENPIYEQKRGGRPPTQTPQLECRRPRPV